jgi:hypothetical protein
MQTQNPDEQSDARERRIRAELQLTIFRRRPVIGDVTRIPQGFDGCSAGAACWSAFWRYLLKLRLAVGAAEWMLGDGAA